MASFLDSAGVTRLVTKLKTIFAVKATTLAGYGITNGVSSVSVTGTGQAVSAASISGHTLTLTKGASLPTVRHERPTSTSTQVSNFTSSEELILDLTAATYSAGAKFWINFLHADITRGYGLYRGCVITGAQSCTVSFGGITSIKGPSRSRPPRSIISRSAPMAAAANIWPRATSYGSASRPRK